MTQCVNVERIQYGVGQGCFHGQEVIYGTEGKNASLYFRLVYDCGSAGKGDLLKWPIKHFTEDKKNVEIDVAYLSHFEIDHVNGLRQLGAAASVKRIFAPFIDWKKGFHIIVEQLFSGVEIAEVVDLADILAEIIIKGTMGGIPVTMVQGGNRPPELPDGRNDPSGNLPEGPGVVEIAGATGKPKVISDSETTTISAGSTGATKSTLWEVVHWYYASDQGLTDSIWNEITKIDGAKTEGFKEAGTHADRADTLDWVSKHSAQVKAAYNRALHAHNDDRNKIGLSPIPENHNVVSLAVYSGPTHFGSAALRNSSAGHGQAYYFEPTIREHICLQSPDSWPRYKIESFSDCRLAWIATGDAMLELQDIWDSFERHFNRTRLERCSTVLIPHHGSSKGKNFNSNLASAGGTCVVAAGANWKYYHPGRETMRQILAKNAATVVVTEATPLGYTEFVGLTF